MKVIRGKYKGRRLLGDQINGTRPTMDRVKESMFAMIQDEVPGAVVLDLFAGSGALGIEACSMGCKKVVFADKNPLSRTAVLQNIQTLGVDTPYSFYLGDYQRVLKNLTEECLSFDLILLDPPYAMEVVPFVFSFVREQGLLKEGGYIVLESARQESAPPGYLLWKAKQYGDKYVHIFCLKKEEVSRIIEEE